MNIYKITAKDIDMEGFYRGKTDLSDFDGHIESDEGLGYVRFKKGIKAKGSILFRYGSSISAGNGISAGWGISAGDGISAGLGISAGRGISAGNGISAGWGISAGDGISAGLGISAGRGISAGLNIECEQISSNLRIFAGTCRWKNPSEEEMQIITKKVVKGEIAFGKLVLT